MFKNLLTAKQVTAVYGIKRTALPKKGQTIAFPSPYDSNVTFVISKTAFTATYGGKLFEVVHEVKS